MAWRYFWLHTMAGLMVAGNPRPVLCACGRGGIALRLMELPL